MRSEARKKALGEVWTPMHVVKDMLSQLPDEIWLDPTKTFLEPGCGHGNFLLGILAYKLTKGPSTVEQALATMHGVDIMEDNVLEARERVLSAAEHLSGRKRTDEWVALIEQNVIVGDYVKLARQTTIK